MTFELKVKKLKICLYGLKYKPLLQFLTKMVHILCNDYIWSVNDNKLFKLPI